MRQYWLKTKIKTTIMPRQAIIPSNLQDPTGADSLERKAMRDVQSRIKKIGREVKRLMKDQPYTVRQLNAVQRIFNAKEYVYQLDETRLAQINSEVGMIVDSYMPQNHWFFAAYAEPAYIMGTSQSFYNLSAQSADYALSRPSLESLLLSEPYKRRIGLIKARVFEEMRGLSETMKTDLGSVLARGMAGGLNPLDIARDIEKKISIEDFRARRIARTEVGHALRTARLDEDQDAITRLGINLKQMHISALSPTTRPDHAARNGGLFTVAEQKAWWAVGARSINCKCNTVAVLVDEKGNPLAPKAVERVRANGTKPK